MTRRPAASWSTWTCSRSLLGVLVSVVAFGCSAIESTEATGTDEEALAASKVGVEGDLTIGEPAHLGAVGIGKRYRALRFTAKAGDRLAIVATAAEGDPVAYVLDAQMKTLALNDDGAPNQKESFIAFDVPADGTYFVAVRNKPAAVVVPHVIGVRYRPASGTYRFPGTCRTNGGSGPKQVALTADLAYEAGNVRLHGLELEPAADVPSELASMLLQAYSSSPFASLYPRIAFRNSSRDLGGWTESNMLFFDVDQGKLISRRSQFGSSIGNYETACEFDTSSIFAPLGAAPAAFPAALEGRTLVATGTCRGSNLLWSMCEPGTPERSPDGCCATSEPLGPSPSELAFKVTSSNGVQRLELISATGAGQTSSLAGRSMTADGTGFRADDVAVPFYTTALRGVLGTNSLSTQLRFEFSGANRAGNDVAYCGADLVQGSCTFAWDAP